MSALWEDGRVLPPLPRPGGGGGAGPCPRDQALPPEPWSPPPLWQVVLPSLVSITLSVKGAVVPCPGLLGGGQRGGVRGPGKEQSLLL